MSCKHGGFNCQLAVHHIEDIGRYQAEFTIECAQCKKPFQFLGLPIGLDYMGAAVSVDRLQLRAAICPEGEPPPSLVGKVTGFIATRVQGPESGGGEPS